MFLNHLKAAYRILFRYKFFSFINVLGLATGLAACLLILQYVQYEKSYESHIPHADRIARLTMDSFIGDEVVTQDAETYRTIGPLLKEELPEVVDYVRMNSVDTREFRLRGESIRQDKIYIGDSTLFKVLAVELVHGDEATALREPFQLVISESVANKLFGKVEVVGESVNIAFGDSELPMKIVGVMKNSPSTTHLKIEAVVSYITATQHFDYEDDDWNGNNDYTYVMLADGVSHEQFQEKLTAVNERLQAEERLDNDRFISQLISDIHLYSHKTYEPEPNGDARTVNFLAIIALIIIVIACVNYVNMTTAKALERAKEVGIRKVIGSYRSQLWGQFMVEATVLNILSGLVALGMVLIALPAFKELAGVPAGLAFWDSPFFWLVFFGLILISVFLSGIYPAVVLSSFKPIATLKGRFTHSDHGQLLRKLLVVFQFTMAVILIAGSFTVSTQVRHMLTKDLGLSMEQTLVVRAPFTDSLLNREDVFRNALMAYPEVKGITFASEVPGLPTKELSSSSSIFPLGSTKKEGYTFYMYSIDPYFVPTLGIEMVEGSEELREEEKENRYVYVNEEATRLWGYKTPQEAIGTQLDFWGDVHTIRGVMKNFHQISVKEPHIPMIMQQQKWSWGYAAIKIETDDMLTTMDKIQKEWDRKFLGSPFEYFFMDDQYDQLYTADKRFLLVFNILTGLAIFIACLGLFGLASFIILQRTKEVGIRKVLGATASQIMVLLSSDFIKLLLVAAVIALPLAYLLLSSWLEGYAYRIELEWWLLVVPALLLVGIAWLSISFQTVKAAQSDPVEALRYE
ncbi:MAG: ABC transporter permease [Bacteroidota bacterium]